MQNKDSNKVNGVSVNLQNTLSRAQNNLFICAFHLLTDLYFGVISGYSCPSNRVNNAIMCAG